MFKLIVQGGPLMVPLVLCSLLSVAFIIERLWSLHKIPTKSQADDCLKDSAKALKNGGVEEAQSFCGERKGILPYIFTLVMDRYDALMHESRTIGEIRDELIASTEEAGRSYLERFLPVLSTVGGVAPLLGLLGTVTGMIVAFKSIAAVGAAGDPRTVAAGISQALITTAAGLIIAIPTVIAYSYFRQRVNKILTGMERFSHGFVDALITEVGRFVSYKETLKLAYADGALEAGEKELLHRKRVLLNISEDKAAQLEQEVKKELGMT
jgi:biopolymer transport protein ExbB